MIAIVRAQKQAGGSTNNRMGSTCPVVEEAVMAEPEVALAVEEVALAQHQGAPLPKSKFVKNLSKSLLN